MYRETLEYFGKAAETKVALLRENPAGYLVSSLLAGVYVGVAIALVFALGGPLYAEHSPWLKTIMGASFGIALSLVIIAGAELFTGNNLTLMIARWQRRASTRDLVAIWVVSWVGNLLGAVLLAALLHGSGVLDGDPERTFVQKVAAGKMTLPAGALLIRGILCNFLVCLAVWCAARVKSETAKLIMIFWCLYAFITVGFEHSVANMTLLPLALFQTPLPEFAAQLTWAGLGHNLLWVTLGNIIGGAIGVGGAYWTICRPTAERAKEPVVS